MRLALFDFDGTLTRGDTLLPFLQRVAGTPLFLAKLARLLPVLGAYACGAIARDRAKESVLRCFLRGWPREELCRLGVEYAARALDRRIRHALYERFQAHRRRGDVCVIVSASLDLYLEPWARRHGFEAVLCSQLEFEAGRARQVGSPAPIVSARKRFVGSRHGWPVGCRTRSSPTGTAPATVKCSPMRIYRTTSVDKSRLPSRRGRTADR